MERMTVGRTAPKPRAAADAGLAGMPRRIGPGLALAAAVAVVSTLAEPAIAGLLRIATGWSYRPSAIVVALVLGIALHGAAARPAFEPGLTWCVRALLRAAIALLGLRIALSDIAALGFPTALLAVAAMTATVAAGVCLARLLAVGDGYGALAGAATAVCGASATLAAATVVPAYSRKSADVAFTVVAANAASTLAMVFYPPLCTLIGFDPQDTGVMLGATIHDMAQVVGAGYAVSEPAGDTAVIVKLFRVLLLLPAVLAIGWWFTRSEAARGVAQGAARVPAPTFALAFLGLCLVNSLLSSLPAFAPAYVPVKAILAQVSAWGLLVAIAALGLGTSVASLLVIGWRHAAVFAGTTLVLLVIVVAGLLLG